MENNTNTAINDSSINKISADDDFRIKETVKKGLTLISIAIIFLSVVALWIVYQINNYQHKVELLSEQAHSLHMMRINARERSLFSYEMITETDDFVADEFRMKIYRAGAEFSRARLMLLKSSLSESELRLLKHQDQIAMESEALMDEVLDLIAYGDKDTALALLKKKIIPSQTKIMKMLDELSASVDKKYSGIKISSDSIVHIDIIVLIAIIIVLIMGVIYIIRQTSQQTSKIVLQMNATRMMLQKTIHELIQQKSALDSHAIVSIADGQGNITYVNDKFSEISGYSRDELIGKKHNILKSGKHPEELYQDLWITISQGNIWQGRICNRRKDGSYYWVESTICPFLDTSGIPYQYVSIRTNVTELLEAKNSAEEANKAKSLFLESMSHELRTPMNAILGFSQLLEMKENDDVAKRNLQEIITAGNHLLLLIDEILDLSKIESEKIELSIDDYRLKDMIDFCLSMVKPSAQSLSIKVDCKTELLPDVKVKVDQQRFRQVILNLLSNAIKYNKEEGGLHVNYSVEDDGMVKLSVADTGVGLSTEQQNHIFHRFDRAGKEASNISGSGLGLFISKHLIEKMNGIIGFESKEGEGSIFWVKIPLA